MLLMKRRLNKVFRPRVYDPPFYWEYTEDEGFCHRGITELFDVPYTAKVLWVCIYNRPAKDRTPIEILPGALYYSAAHCLIDVKELDLLIPMYRFRRFWNKHMGESLYIDLWYEE